MVCVRYIIVNTLHKEDDKDDDDKDNNNNNNNTRRKNKIHKILTTKHHDKTNSHE